MRGSECLTFANRPDRIGGLARAVCLDGADINQDYDYDKGQCISHGDAAQNWDETRIADVLRTRPGADSLVIVNLEGLDFANPLYTQSDSVIDKKIGELIAWVKMFARLKQPTACLALDGAGAWDMGMIAQYRRPTCDDYWRKIAYICDRYRADVLPMVDAVCVQAYYNIRWNDPTKDLYGDGTFWGNFRAWQVHANALKAFTTKPAIAFFSPSIVAASPGIAPRALNDWEIGQSMFYLSGFGFSEICWWGTVDGPDKSPGGWNKWDGKAAWVARMLKYWDKDGNFVADPAWNYTA